MKQLLIEICKEYGYIDPPNRSGITLDLIIDGIIERTNITQYLMSNTGCSNTTTTSALKKAFPDRHPAKDRDLRKFLLAKRGLRYCNKCDTIKSTTDFYTNASKSDGLQEYCKLCKNEARRADYKKDPQKELALDYIRKHRKDELQTPNWANLEEIQKIYSLRPEGCHVDHIIPLNGKYVSGLHCEHNLQYLKASINMSKSNKFDIDGYIHSFNYEAPY